MSKNFCVENYPLDNYQMELINSNNNSMVIAGAGSGKTLTIIGKINYLIEKNITIPEKILIISFTNASVNDLKKRINYNVHIYTFHKLAMYILEKVNYNYKICNTSLLRYIIEEEIKISSPQNQKYILKFLKLKIKFAQFLISNEFKSFCNLIETFINLWKTNNYTFENIKLKKYTKLEKRILLIIFKIYQKYTIEKNSIGELDFDDLILMATKLVKNSNINFDYIFIDEFQDTSYIRLNLIKEIYNSTNCKIIVVGDDWQSIYRFSGCDLNIFINFNQFFPNIQKIKLVNTYRNSQELINIAAKFIEKNPLQIKKSLKSSKNISTPFIFVPYTDKKSSLKKILDHLIPINKDIMILTRNNKDIYDYIDEEYQLNNNTLTYKNIDLKFYTVHKSKGLEAFFVIILNCNQEILGFPNQIENNVLLQKQFKNYEIKFAEERRLFYVAITRCKEQTYLLYAKNNPSIFIKELKKIVKKKLKKITYFQ